MAFKIILAAIALMSSALTLVYAAAAGEHININKGKAKNLLALTGYTALISLLSWVALVIAP